MHQRSELDRWLLHRRSRVANRRTLLPSGGRAREVDQREEALLEFVEHVKPTKWRLSITNIEAMTYKSALINVFYDFDKSRVLQ